MLSSDLLRVLRHRLCFVSDATETLCTDLVMHHFGIAFYCFRGVINSVQADPVSVNTFKVNPRPLTTHLTFALCCIVE